MSAVTTLIGARSDTDLDQAPAQARETPTNLKVTSLDAWRGFACLFVVFMHACMPTILNVYPSLARQPIFALSLHGGLGVSIFFCISGFCITNAAANLLGRADGVRAYVLARLRRIYPPYVGASFLVLALTLLVTYAVRHHLVASSARSQMDIAHQGLGFLLASVSLTQVPFHQLLLIGPVWSLDYEVTFYVVVLAVMAIVRHLDGDRRLFVNMLHAITIASLIVATLSPAFAIYPFDLWPEFGVGVLLYDLLAHPRTKRPLYVGALIVASFGAYLWLHDVPATQTGQNSTLAIYGTCIFTAIVVWLSHPYEAHLRRIAPIRWLSRIGIFSYSLYLTHEPVTGLVLQIAKRLHLFTIARYPVVFVLQIVIAVAVGYGFYVICEAPFLSRRDRAIHAAAT